MAAALFVIYSAGDIQETDWLTRLRMYLAPFGRRGTISAWDDSRISPGTRWREEITGALHDAEAAVLLVGPAFLASDFVIKHELTALLHAAHDRGVVLFPLIVKFCSYHASDLHAYQAFNSHEAPLESLSRPEQNKILNALAIAIAQSLPAGKPKGKKGQGKSALYRTVLAIKKDLKDNRTAFLVQCRRRDDLVAAIEERLQVSDDLEYEQFFFHYHSQMTGEERFEFDQIRAITEGTLQLGNHRILEALDSSDAVLKIAPEMTVLRQHLVFWLNKFDRVFSANQAMCMLYTDVDDGVPFPRDLREVITAWKRSLR